MRIEDSLEYISKLYILIFLDSANFFVIFNAILKLLLAFARNLKNIYKVVKHGEDHKKYKFLYLGPLLFIQRTSFYLYLAVFVKNYGYYILLYSLISVGFNFVLELAIFKLYNKIENSDKFFKKEEKEYR